MRKRGERALTELYDITERIREAEITPVLEGNCRIQGPADESDPVLQRTHLGGFLADKKVTFISESYHMGIESGTCNVCSAPCSSCMHNNRTMSTMESKLEHGSSSNRYVNNEDDSCSFICADGLHLYRSRICDVTQRTASEASNLLSTSSSHGSYSENAESKAPVTASVTCEASEGVVISAFVPLGEEDQDQSLQQNKSVIGECLYPSNSHVTSDLCHSASSKRDGELQRLECHGNNISHVTGSKDSSIGIDHNISSDKKISTHGYTSFDDLHCTKVKTKTQVKATDCHGVGNEQRQGNYKRQIAITTESSQKTCEDSANASVSDRANTADVHMTKHNSSVKGDSSWSPSQNRYAAFYNDDCKDSDCSRGSQHHVNGESSSGTQQAGPAGLAEKKPSSHLENSKAYYAGNSFLADSMISMDPCLKNKIGLDEGITSDQVMKSTIINKEFEMFSSSMDEVSKMQESEPQPQQVMESGNSEPELTDVKVCDICGDAGREYLLAFCSRCNDGAEHTYCMRKMLRKVPEGDWLCEECRLKEETERKKTDTPGKVSGTANNCKLKEDDEVKVDRAEKLPVTAKGCKRKDHAEAKKGIIPEAVKEHSKVKKGNVSEAIFRTSKECKQEDLASKKGDASETVPGTLKQACHKDTSQNFANNSNLKLMPKLDLKAIGPDVRKVHKELQSPTIIANRREESQEVMTPSRKRSLESSEISVKSTEMSSPRKRLASSRESSFKNLEMGKTMAANMPPTNAGQNRNNSEGFPRSQSMLGYHSSKVQAQLRPPCGFLSRSSSFNGVKSKPKVKQVEVASVKPKFVRGYLLNDTRRGETSRLMMKSASFKSTISGHNTESASKSQFRVEDPRSPKPAKERNIIGRKNSFTLDRSLSNSSPGAGTNISLPRLEIKTAPHDIKLSSTYESTNLRMNKGSDDANDSGRKEAKEQSVPSAKILRSISLNPKGKNEAQRLCQIPNDSANERSTCNDTLYNNAETMQCQRVPQIMELVHRDNKTKDSGYFSISRLEVADGTRLLRCQRCNETNHATQFCPIEKLPTSALKPSAQKNCNNGIKKRTRWQDAVATILNSSLQKNMSQGGESEELPIFSADACSEDASKVLLCSSSNHPRNTPLLTKGTSNGQEISRITDGDPSMLTAVKDVGLPFSPSAEASPTSRDVQLIEASFTPEIRDSDATASISEGLNTKHLVLTAVKDVGLPFSPPVEASPTSRGVQLIEASFTPEIMDLDATASISEGLNTKHLMLTAVKDVGLPLSPPVEASPSSRDVQLIEASFTPEIRDLDATASISEGLNTKNLGLTAVKDVGLPFSPPDEASPTSRDVQLKEASSTPEIRDLDATASISEGLNTKHLVLTAVKDVGLPFSPPVEASPTSRGVQLIEVSFTPEIRDLDATASISEGLNTKHLMLTAVKDVDLPFSPPVEVSPTSRDVQLIEASFIPEIRDLDATTSTSEGLNTKHSMSDQAIVLANLYRTSAIPHLEFIWQGSFELLTTGNESAPFDGIQAHVSTSASPKVLELATKFPCKVQLEEVPWYSSRPLHFQRIGPNEHDIALFFFAKDVESYERSYSKLLGKMLTNDIGLRGIINGVELLIFPSTKLPLHSQRWNRLFFLWGMFKGRVAKSFASELNSRKKPFGPDLNVDPVLQDLPCVLSSVVPDSHKAVSVENPQDESCMCDVLSKAKVTKSTRCEETWATSSPKVDNRMCSTQCSPVHTSSFQNAAFSRLSMEQNSCLIPITNSLPCSEVKIDDTYLNKRGNEFGGRRAVTPSTQVPRTSKQIRASRASTSCSTADWQKGEESRIIDGGMGEEISTKNEAIFYEDPRRKRAGLCSTEAVSQARDREGHSNGNFREEIFSVKLPSNVQPLFPSYLNGLHGDCRDDDSGESINHDNTRRQDERFFFPVKPDNPIHILSSDEEDAEESNFPNLELALWDNKKKRKDRQWKETLDEDDSASLSLSLALPSPKKGGRPNPNLNPVRDSQESPDVNTALLLFGGGLTGT